MPWHPASVAWRYNKGGGAVWLISKGNSVIPDSVDPGLDDWPIEIENCADVTLDRPLSLLTPGHCL